MSIAVSVLSGPSKAGTLLMAVVSTALIAVGAISIAHYFGDSAKIAVSMAIAGAVLAISSCDVLRKRRRKVRLTISDTGQISLIRQGQQHFSDAGQADIVQMMPGSTLWSFFLLLRLRQQNKKTTVVSFFLYSLSPQSFRRLSVACRWVAARNDAAQAHLQPNASPY
jgi:toxin CptA